MSQQLSTVYLDYSIVDMKSGRDLTKFAQKIQISKSVGGWYAEIQLSFKFPKEVYLSLLPFYNLQLNLQLYLIKNNQIQDTDSVIAIPIQSFIQNTLDTDDAIQTTLVLAPIQIQELQQRICLYLEGETSLLDIMNKILSYVTNKDIDKPQNNSKFYDVFIPQTTVYNALAYVCREFGYDSDVYHAWVDTQTFRLKRFSMVKDSVPKTKFVIAPQSIKTKDAIVYSISYMERDDIKNLYQFIPKSVIQHNYYKSQPFCKNNNPITSLGTFNSQQQSFIHSLNDYQFLTTVLTPMNKLWFFDIFYPVNVFTEVKEFQSLIGFYTVTDIMIVCDLTKENNIPANVIRLLKRG